MILLVTCWCLALTLNGGWKASPKSVLKENPIYDISEVDVAPRPVLVSNLPEKIYPLELYRDGIEGEVIIEFVINEIGETESLKVLKSTNKQFSESAIKAISAWLFYAATKDGKLVSSKLKVKIPFVIGNSREDGQGSSALPQIRGASRGLPG